MRDGFEILINKVSLAKVAERRQRASLSAYSLHSTVNSIRPGVRLPSHLRLHAYAVSVAQSRDRKRRLALFTDQPNWPRWVSGPASGFKIYWWIWKTLIAWEDNWDSEGSKEPPEHKRRFFNCSMAIIPRSKIWIAWSRKWLDSPSNVDERERFLQSLCFSFLLEHSSSVVKPTRVNSMQKWSVS